MNQTERQIDELYTRKHEVSSRECATQADFLAKCEEMNAIDRQIAKLRAMEV